MRFKFIGKLPTVGTAGQRAAAAFRPAVALCAAVSNAADSSCRLNASTLASRMLVLLGCQGMNFMHGHVMTVTHTTMGACLMCSCCLPNAGAGPEGGGGECPGQ